MKGLEGKVAVVTGGASGIRYSIVEQLLDHGTKVVNIGIYRQFL